MCLAPDSALGSPGVSEVLEKWLGYVSENVESNETTEAVLNMTGDMQISLSLQETM